MERKKQANTPSPPKNRQCFQVHHWIPARNRVFTPVAHPAPSPSPALPLLGAAGRLLPLPSPALPSAPSRTSSSPRHCQPSGSLGTALWLSAGWLRGDCKVNRWSQMARSSAQVTTVTVQQIKLPWVSEKPLSQVFFFLAAPRLPPKQLLAAAQASQQLESLWTLMKPTRN